MRIAAVFMLAFALIAPAIAQDKPAADRGDAKAEKLLKKAWERVQSAEASGLTRLKSEMTITTDAKSVGRGEMTFGGQLLWKSGSKAAWVAPAGGAEATGPMAAVANIARRLFEPYLAYVVGFESWGVKFKEASFKMGEPVKDAEGKKTGDQVVVTYADKRVETFTVAENRVARMSKEDMIDENKAIVEFTYTFEDTGKMLRLSKVETLTRMTIGGLPGEEAEGEPVESKVEGSIEIKKYGKAGEYDIAVELSGSLSLMGMKFPTNLAVKDPKVNKDVTDEDLKPLDPPAAEKPAEDKPAEEKPAEENPAEKAPEKKEERAK